MSLIAKLSVLVLLVIIALVFLGANRKPEGFSFKPIKPTAGAFSSGEEKKKTINTKTRLLPCLILDQLDPKTLRTVKSFEIHDIPYIGVSVCNPHATRGDIILVNSGEEALTVSHEHLRIGRDDEGMYVQDSGSANKTYTREGRIVDEAEITDGLILFLGTQPVRFRIPNPMAMFANLEFEPAGTHVYTCAEGESAHAYTPAEGPMQRRKK